MTDFEKNPFDVFRTLDAAINALAERPDDDAQVYDLTEQLLDAIPTRVVVAMLLKEASVLLQKCAVLSGKSLETLAAERRTVLNLVEWDDEFDDPRGDLV